MSLEKFRPIFEKNNIEIEKLEKTIVESKEALDEVKYSLRILEQRNEVLEATINERRDFIKLYESLTKAPKDLDVVESSEETFADKANKKLSDHTFVLKGKGYKKREYDSQLAVKDGLYYVLKGSSISSVVSSEKSSHAAKYRRPHLDLIEDDYTISEDVPFDNPTMAATFVKGTVGNGWKEWIEIEKGAPLGLVLKGYKGVDTKNV